MPYQPYFSLSIRHSYYRQQDCSDVSLAPTQGCQNFLQRHRCLAKSDGRGLHVLVSLDDQQRPLIPLDEGAIFTFLLKLNNPKFTNFTQLDAGYQPGRHFYVFSNENIDAGDEWELRSQVFSFQDLHQKNASPLLTRCAAIAELNTLQRRQIFGVVEIHPRNNFGQVTDQPPAFKIGFTAQARRWSYYLVTDQSVAADAFSIRDQDTNAQRQKLSFSRVDSDASDRLIATIQQQFPHSQTVVFQSDTPVPCQDQGRAHLQLMKRGHNTAWLPHLPNPPNDHGIQVINLLTDV